MTDFKEFGTEIKRILEVFWCIAFVLWWKWPSGPLPWSFSAKWDWTEKKENFKIRVDINIWISELSQYLQLSTSRGIFNQQKSLTCVNFTYITPEEQSLLLNRSQGISLRLHFFKKIAYELFYDIYCPFITWCSDSTWSTSIQTDFTGHTWQKRAGPAKCTSNSLPPVYTSCLIAKR